MENIVDSKRIQYTASRFAKDSLIFLQEAGISKTIKKHTSSRNNMTSFLFFIVLDGNGILNYNGNIYKIKKGDCVFVDCHFPYSHTSSNWQIAWLHFNGNNVKDIYQKYLQRNGHNVFFSNDILKYYNLIRNVYETARSNDYIRDMNIYNQLSNLLYMLMNETIYSEENKKNYKYDINAIKEYIDVHYEHDISLDQLSSIFFINKYYLTRAFKQNYGTTINTYILEKRITKAKELLRFSSSSIEDISVSCGIKDPNYFSRLFKKVEGITPKKYQKMW